MARPVHVGITSGLAAWDGEVDDNFDLLFSTPAPLAIYANFAGLPTASDYDECIAVISDEDVLCISDGSNWKRIGTQGAAVTDATASPVSLTDPADTPATADALRDDLVANLIPELRTEIDDLKDQFNALLASLRASDVIAT